MEMKVDSKRIRAEREKRGWSQEHLASVAGLSLRTIQRIENAGSASFESATALASVLAVDVVDLRVNQSEPARAQAIRLSLELPMRLALAAIAGVLCALHFNWRSFNTNWSLGFEWFDYGMAGALFGAAVLFPYLRFEPWLVLRAFGLIAASALSYFCAVWVTIGAGFTLPTFLLGSFIGVAIVLAAARFLIALRVTATFWVVGIAASLIGGAAMYVGFEVFGETTWSRGVGYVVWHMAACLAIFYGRQSNDAESGFLADIIRRRGRFSIVAGWIERGILIPRLIMRHASVRSPIVLLLVLTAAAAAEPKALVGPLEDQRAIRGCTWSAWIPSKSPSLSRIGEGYIFLADRDDSKAVMNIGGKDVTLVVEDAFSRLPVRGEVLRRTYRGPGIEVRAEYTTTDDCSKSNNEACEVSMYSVRFEVQQGGQTQVVSAVGTVGC